ncbi:MAG: winged helix-turn-helix domain-containing protein [Steroidobacteraceae bacterium]
MAQVWPGLVVSTETVVQRVKLLRAALHENPNAPRYIASMRGRGYHLVVEVVRHEAAAIVPSLVEPRALDDLAVTRVIAAPGTPALRASPVRRGGGGTGRTSRLRWSRREYCLPASPGAHHNRSKRRHSP